MADAALFGLGPYSADDIREMVGGLPFLPAFTTLARLTLRFWGMRRSPEEHLQLAREVYGDSEIVGLFAASQADEAGSLHLFSEQQFFVLARLLVESASTEESGWSTEHGVVFNQALFAVTSILGERGSALPSGKTTLADWLGFFAQNGVYNASRPLLETYTRTWRIYMELATTAAARSHPAYCDFEALHRRAAGVGVKELFAVGFAAAQNAQHDYNDPERVGLVPPMSVYLTGTRMEASHAELTTALSAARSEYCAGFERDQPSAARVAWDVTPFFAKPFFRLPDDALLLTSPRAVHGFLTDGVHYRLLDAAAATGERNRFTSFVGWLFERYVYELLAAALGERPPGSGKVLGEQTYNRGRELTSDVVLDFGTDLVLFEVVSTRMPLGVQAEADAKELATFVSRAVTDKVAQLDRVLTDVLGGRAVLPSVDPAHLQRIWPVVVTTGDLTIGEPLWDYISGATTALLRQPQAQPLTLLSIAEVELLSGAIAAGGDLLALLRSRLAQGYGGLSLTRYLNDRGDLVDAPRLPLLEQRWKALTDECAALLRTPA